MAPAGGGKRAGGPVGAVEMRLAGTEGKFVDEVGGGAGLDPGKLIQQAVAEVALAFEGVRVVLMSGTVGCACNAGIVGEGARIGDGLVEETDGGRSLEA